MRFILIILLCFNFVAQAQSRSSGSSSSGGGSGTVTSITNGTGIVPVTITSSGTITVDVGTAANKIVQLTSGAQYPAVDGFLITNISAANKSLSNLSALTNINADFVFNTGAAATVKTQNAAAVTKAMTLTTGDASGANNSGALTLSTGSSGSATRGAITLDGGAFNVFGLAGDVELNSYRLISQGTVHTEAIGLVDFTTLSNFRVESTATFTGLVTGQAGFDSGGFVVANVATPVVSTDAANKAYVDSSLTGTAYVRGGNAFLTNSNIGLTSAFNLNVITSGTPRMTVTAAGNVGIGTTSPATHLQVYTNAASTALSLINVSTSGRDWRLLSVGSGSVAGLPGSFALFDAATSLTRMTVDASGLVGIGTTSPQAGLDVASTGTASALLVPRDTTLLRPAPVNGMIRYNTNTNYFEGYENGAWANLSAAGENAFVSGGNAFGANVNIGLTDSFNLSVITAGTARMTVTSLGNIGVGVTAPVVKFEADGDIRADRSGTPSQSLTISASTAGGPTITAAGASKNFTISNSSAGSMFFQTNNFGTSVTLTDFGQFGIGTVSPQAALDVFKTGTASAIIVPRDTTAGRPTPVNGMIRYNTNTSFFEAYEAGNWVNMTPNGASAFVANGNAFGANTNIGLTDAFGLKLITNNLARMTITGTGNIGIGTTIPSAMFVVNQAADTTTSAANTFAILINDQAANRFAFGSDSNYGYIQSFGGKPLSINPQGNNIILVPGTGNVGIGTTSPSSLLDIGATYQVTADMKILNANPNIILQRGTATANTDWEIRNSGGLFFSAGYDSSTNNAFRAAAAVILTTGEVGIGSTTPFAILDVKGAAATAATAALSVANSSNTSMLYVNNGGNVGIGTTSITSILHVVGTATATNAFITTENSSGTKFWFGTTRGGFSNTFSIGTGAISDGVGKVNIDTSGNVGVGTLTPGAVLDVKGASKLGTSGTPITAQGSCTIASAAWTLVAVTGNTCTSVPSSSAYVFCSPVTPQTGQTYAATATAANTVTIVASATGTTALVCYWVLP